ncbi:MAG: SMP-30/gluconolactonase/LRE family protein [Planctomycetota bacterium]
MPPNPRLIANYQCNTGEGPLWHPDEQALYWMDIPPGRLFRYDPATDEHETVREGRTLGAATLQADGSLLLMGGPGCTASTWRDGVETPSFDGIPGETRFNDAIADPEGRIFSGSMAGEGWQDDPAKLGKLYRLDPDGSAHVVDEGFGCVNGMGFTADLNTFFFIDTFSMNVYAYGYDRATGAIVDRRVHIDTRGVPGKPDGMAIDADGCFWVARWGGSCVVRFDPDGQEMSRLPLPTPNVTSVAFAGPDLSTMYITTAGCNDPETFGREAGALFAVEIDGVRGVPEYRSRFRLDR